MRPFLLVVVRFFVCLSFVSVCFGQNSLRVNELQTQIFFSETASEVSLAIENARGETSVQAKLEILTSFGNIAAVSSINNFPLKKGVNVLKIPLTIQTLFKDDDWLLYRLRYEVSTANTTTKGIIAVSEIAPEIFELEIVASETVRENSKYRVQVQSVQPVSKRKIAKVEIEADLKLEIKIPEDSDADDEIILKTNAQTDAEGFATLDFTIPKNVRLANDADIKITGKKGGIIREVKEDLSILARNSVYLNTDKPLYQPAQTLNFRVLTMNSANVILFDLPLKIEIKDGDGETLHRAEIKTSRFGIASYAWQIPESAKLGGYRIEIENDDFDIDETVYFKVSRYDLPNFAVNAKPDKTFYLPENETAEIEIRADYLFGKPVTKGKVRVVQELEREWNYQAQKYDTKEGEIREGEFDAAGKFIAKFDLKDEQEDFKPSNYRRFKDLNFAAYVTDLTTNRTEQRRFDVRLTNEPIHVYLIGNTYNLSNKLAPKFYLTTFYADGTPASCNFAVYDTKKTEFEKNEVVYENTKLLTKFQTNSRGVAKLEFPVNSFAETPGRLNFLIVAVDKDGKRGTFNGDLNFDEDEPAIQVSTDKTIYKRGEKIKVSIVSSEQAADLFVDVSKDWSVLRSERIKLENGRATFEIPYQKEFKNSIQIVAYNEFDDEIESGGKAVIFPTGRGLTVKAETAKNEFRPGEDAKISFQATQANGKTSETALGVVILDKAIEERARTDGEFGGYRSFYRLLGYESFGGVTRNDLENLDLRQPITPEFNLSAEVLLNQNNYFSTNFFRSRDFSNDLRDTYKPIFDRQFAPVKTAFDSAYNKRREFPRNEAEMQAILLKENVDFATMRDAWGNPFRTKFNIYRNEIKLEIISNGADKKAETKDDITAFQNSFYYFAPLAEKLDKAVLEYNKRTNDFIRDLPKLHAEMLKQFDLDIETWRDPWGNPYRFRFAVENSNFVIYAESAGANGKFEDDEKNYWQKDDATLWSNRADYFSMIRSRLAKGVTEIVQKNSKFPSDEAEFKAILQQLNFNLETEKDVFGRPYYLTKTESLRFGNRVQIKKIGEVKTNITPVTQQLVTFKIKSVGYNGIKDTYDDFELIFFTGVVGEKTKDDATSQSTVRKIITTDGKGAIAGTLFDANGAVIANATCNAKNIVSGEIKSVVTNDEGNFLFDNLPSGTYELSCFASGFRRSVFQSVPVEQGNVTQVEVVLEVGSVSEAVNITSDSVVLETTASSVSSTVSIGSTYQLPTSEKNYLGLAVRDPFMKPVKVSDLPEDDFQTEQPSETPRLREYFPETLLWSPEVITDKRGKAEVKFKLADSITTWKIGVIASNLEGEIGVTEKEIQAFQPFFADHDPPKFLTEGDRIFLPVVIRNYLNSAQTVNVSMKEESWFKLNGSPTQKITVAPADSSNAIFDFRAIDYVKGGKQRVTALAKDANDAIEKLVTVRPNGQEIVKTESKIFQDAAIFDVNFPADALPKTPKAELKIYPNLTAHVAEAVEGILRRPYGCAEQTISSSYPSLLWLKMSEPPALAGGAKPNANSTPKTNSALNAKAKRYLKLGYERLLGYQKTDGSFGYWANDTANLALTAYALRFLGEVDGFIEIDEKVLDRTSEYLLKQQRADGSWSQNYSWEKTENLVQTKQTTAYIAKILAKNATAKEDTEAAKKALNYLKPKVAEIDEPYSLANFALIAFEIGETEIAMKTVERLRGLAKSEANGVYWNLETNTPFYGWGYTGRIETSALVIQALLKAEEISKKGANPQSSEEISKGLQFLLKSKDRYGVWYSSQATVNVLDALILALKNGEQNTLGEIPQVEIFANGNRVLSELLPKLNEPANPIFVDISPFLNLTNNKIEIKQSGTKNFVMAQVVQNHYVSWAKATELGFTSNDSRGLRLKVDFDKTTAKISDEITCNVTAERVGFQGYGMLLAEIGIPPGAEVSRESLEKARENNWNFSRYDILPDRIIVYLWANAGGNKFSFTFKPRYGIDANNPASTIYDYYNPESNTTVAPVKFNFK